MWWSPKADDNLGSASGHRVRTTALSSGQSSHTGSLDHGLRVKGEAAMFGLLLPTMLITIIRFKDLFVSIESRHNCFSMCLKKIELFLSVCDGEIQKLGCQPLDFSRSQIGDGSRSGPWRDGPHRWETGAHALDTLAPTRLK